MLARQLPKTVADHSHSEISRLTVLHRDILTVRFIRLGRTSDRRCRKPALQHRGSRADAPARRVPVDPLGHGDGPSRGRRAARRRARRQGIRRAQREGALLRQGSSPRDGVADGVLADSARVFRAGAHRPVRDVAVARRGELPQARCSSSSTSASASGARRHATRSRNGRVPATSRRSGCCRPASTRRAAARRSASPTSSGCCSVRVSGSRSNPATSSTFELLSQLASRRTGVVEAFPDVEHRHRDHLSVR